MGRGGGWLFEIEARGSTLKGFAVAELPALRINISYNEQARRCRILLAASRKLLTDPLRSAITLRVPSSANRGWLLRAPGAAVRQSPGE